MRLLDGQLVLSPGDLTKFTRCAHVTTLDLGRLRGTLKPLVYPQKSQHTEFIAEKGTEHAVARQSLTRLLRHRHEHLARVFA